MCAYMYICIYIYIYMYIHTHVYIYIYIYILSQARRPGGPARSSDYPYCRCCFIVTPGLHHKISVFSDPDPGKS